MIAYLFRTLFLMLLISGTAVQGRLSHYCFRASAALIYLTLPPFRPLLYRGTKCCWNQQYQSVSKESCPVEFLGNLARILFAWVARLGSARILCRQWNRRKDRSCCNQQRKIQLSIRCRRSIKAVCWWRWQRAPRRTSWYGWTWRTPRETEGEPN